jgi:hypothetical protein
MELAGIIQTHQPFVNLRKIGTGAVYGLPAPRYFFLKTNGNRSENAWQSPADKPTTGGAAR